MKIYVLTVFGLLYLAACTANTEQLYKAVPVTERGAFTSGIEGPACDIHGNLYAVNYKAQGTIGKVTHSGKGAVYVTLPEGSVGNGIRFDQTGNMFIADYPQHNILRVDHKSGALTLFAHEPRMNQPNDLAIDNRGNLYASDPSWAKKTGQLWFISSRGQVRLLNADMGTTNGIEVSPNGLNLYVNESVQRNVWVFDIDRRGDISNKQLLRKFEDFGFDGMRCDIKGNLYITRHGKGTVVVLSPLGEIIREIDVLGKSPTNLCFGGADGRTVYVTDADQKRIVKFRVDYPGYTWSLNKQD